MAGENLPLMNEGYLLDTTTISNILRRKPSVLKQIRQVSPTEVYVSTVSQYEVEYGFVLSPNSRIKFEADLHKFYQEIRCLPLTTEIAIAAASVASQLKEKGKPIGLPDVLIAATAITEGLIVVTSNTRHFERIEGIKLVDWKK